MINPWKKRQEKKDQRLKQQMVEVFNDMKRTVSETSIEDVEKSDLSLYQAALNAKELDQANQLLFQLLRHDFNKRIKSDIIPSGFTKFLDWDQISESLEKLESENVRNVLATTLKEYPRPIPSINAKKIEKAKEYFDEIVIIYTDYTGKERGKVSQARKERDPIAFGVLTQDFVNPISGRKTTTAHNQAFFITDWIDENCDLTLDKLLKESAKIGIDLEEKEIHSENIDEMFESTFEPVDGKKISTNIFSLTTTGVSGLE